MIDKNMDKEYAGITGVPNFTKAAGALAYGDESPAIKENRVCLFVTFQIIIILTLFHSSLLLNLSPVLVLSVWVLNS
jgi:hypothetical protein